MTAPLTLGQSDAFMSLMIYCLNTLYPTRPVLDPDAYFEALNLASIPGSATEYDALFTNQVAMIGVDPPSLSSSGPTAPAMPVQHATVSSFVAGDPELQVDTTFYFTGLVPALLADYFNTGTEYPVPNLAAFFTLVLNATPPGMIVGQDLQNWFFTVGQTSEPSTSLPTAAQSATFTTLLAASNAFQVLPKGVQAGDGFTVYDNLSAGAPVAVLPAAVSVPFAMIESVTGVAQNTSAMIAGAALIAAIIFWPKSKD